MSVKESADWFATPLLLKSLASLLTRVMLPFQVEPVQELQGWPEADSRGY